MKPGSKQTSPGEAVGGPAERRLFPGYLGPEKPDLRTSGPLTHSLLRFWADIRSGLNLARQVRSEVKADNPHLLRVK